MIYPESRDAAAEAQTQFPSSNVGSFSHKAISSPYCIFNACFIMATAVPFRLLLAYGIES